MITDRSHPTHLTVKGVCFFCSIVSKLDSGYYYVLLTAVARQGNVHRTVFYRSQPSPNKLRQTMLKWADKLPLDAIN